MTQSAPSRARRRAMARPIPREPPVTTATRPARGDITRRAASARAERVVPEAGLEPAGPCGHRILSAARLPISPLRRTRGNILAEERAPGAAGRGAPARLFHPRNLV